MGSNAIEEIDHGSWSRHKATMGPLICNGTCIVKTWKHIYYYYSYDYLLRVSSTTMWDNDVSTTKQWTLPGPLDKFNVTGAMFLVSWLLAMRGGALKGRREGELGQVKWSCGGDIHQFCRRCCWSGEYMCMPPRHPRPASGQGRTWLQWGYLAAGCHGCFTCRMGNATILNYLKNIVDVGVLM